jgi:hypothetical protein
MPTTATTQATATPETTPPEPVLDRPRGRHRKPRPRRTLFAVGGLALAAGALSLLRMTPQPTGGGTGVEATDIDPSSAGSTEDTAQDDAGAVRRETTHGEHVPLGNASTSKPNELQRDQQDPRQQPERTERIGTPKITRRTGTGGTSRVLRALPGSRAEPQPRPRNPRSEATPEAPNPAPNPSGAFQSIRPITTTTPPTRAGLQPAPLDPPPPHPQAPTPTSPGAPRTPPARHRPVRTDRGLLLRRKRRVGQVGQE